MEPNEIEVNFETYQFASPSYVQSIELRSKILRIPLGLDFKEEDLRNEWQDYHLGAFNTRGELCGCLVLVHKTESEVKMRQVAVDDKFQGQGIGQKLVKYSEHFALYKGYKSIVLNARQAAIPFYLKLDYKSIGSEFVEVGIPHQKMQKVL